MSTARSTRSFEGRVAETRRLFRRLGLVLLVFVSGTFLAALGYSQYKIGLELEAQAASYIDLIVSAREWIAVHDGVYVEVGPDARSNPYLADIGVAPDILAEDGRVLTMRNPAIMTRELSELAKNRFGVVFHITSDEPLNPENTADEWESESLAVFREGVTEARTVEGSRGARVYRYMEPLFIEERCLTCHGPQGYQVGDLRGGISVNIPYEPVRDVMFREATVLGLFALLMGLLVLGTMGSLIGRYRVRLDEAAVEVETMASTDALTGLANRWIAISRLEEEIARARRMHHSLAVLMIDIDHFKRVNDTYGHAAGDAVLREIAVRIRSAVRDYDIPARIGGEEFVVIAPETSGEAAEVLAGRVHAAVRAEPIAAGEDEIRVTVSVGIGGLQDADVGPDPLLRRADDALYQAKDSGRDCVIRG